MSQIVYITFLAVKPKAGAVVEEICYIIEVSSVVQKQRKIDVAIEEISRRGFVVLRVVE